MDIQQVANDTDYSVRTQISLSPSLYQLIKKKAKREDKSLAQVIRDNLLAHLQEEQQREDARDKRINELIERVRALGGKSGWEKVKNHHKLIRRWRKEDDEHRQKMMEKVGVEI
ncbi:ribbon-helix-helix protein, CopG family [Candidatus Gottesmanbacteria bacterium]|nr:ribbon-helix-helix protein, CopG family [Candidatus Gottesmanbacteria bacterium]